MLKQDVDCAVIIALREEFTGQRPHAGFDEFFEMDVASVLSPFQHFSFIDSTGMKRVGVVVVMEDMSPLSAYEACRDLLDLYNPQLVVNIGIAGALSKDLRLGDVLIADEVDAYDYRGKAVPVAHSQPGDTATTAYHPKAESVAAGLDDFTFIWGGKSLLPSSEPTQAVSRLWQVTRQFEQWQKESIDRLHHAKNILSSELIDKGYLHDMPRLEHGVIASGNTVSASTAFRNRLLNSHSRILLAIEMESAGVLRATSKREGRSLIIKAISDLADENKEHLDSSTNDAVRAWAMSNAFHILSIACREVLVFETKRIVRSSEDHSTHPSASEERSKSLDFSLKHFKKQHRSLVNNIDDTLSIYDALFRPIIHSDELSKGNIFDECAKIIVASSNPYPLRIDGKPGTGKTTFLTILYLAMYKFSCVNPDWPIPVYINLRRYTTPERGKEHHWSPRSVSEDDLAVLRRLLKDDSPFNLVLLIDGIEEYVRYDDAIEMEVLELIANCQCVKKVVGIGTNYLANRERFVRRLRGDLNSPEMRVVLEATPVNDATKVHSLIRAFQRTYHGATDDTIADQILKRAVTFRLNALDLLVLSMLFDGVVEKGRFGGADNLGDFLKIYCEGFLQTRTGSESLDEAAQLAFEYTVKPHFGLPAEKVIFRRSWKLLHLHSMVRDFLVAWHTVVLVRKAGTQSEQARLEDLDYVYPHNINRFCKDIVNATRDSQFEVIDGAKRIFHLSGNNAKPHAAYLAGRVTDFSAKEQARAWLRAECLPEVEKLQLRRDSELSSGELLLCRTVYISLAVLSDRAASEAYITLLLERPAWNEINRGFHLEYYGDIAFDPERQLSHSDDLAPFPKTFANLYERVQANLRNSKYGLLDVEVFTLFSLAQFRFLAVDRLDLRMRTDLVSLAPSLIASRQIGDSVREYVKMLGTNLKDKTPFLPGKVVEKVFGLKTQLRAGWVDRVLDLKRIESVADHTMGAILLGIVFLPEENARGWSGYDKGKVLTYLIIHDLGESIAGDASPLDPARYQAAKERERDAFHYLMMSRTYPGIANLAHYHQLWEAFESGADENAKIARDLDRLENLVQLYIYRRDVQIPDFEVWRDTLKSHIGTEIGKDILGHLQDYFEQGEGT